MFRAGVVGMLKQLRASWHPYLHVDEGPLHVVSLLWFNLGSSHRGDSWDIRLSHGLLRTGEVNKPTEKVKALSPFMSWPRKLHSIISNLVPNSAQV